ncbi:DUF222 domain-containing protein [Tersicoccus sp. MR15.9]|uniref:HNH endonuclease signature motif containing protein n=1 Tax=Tersicoccus mangrovi TaxID=3121635 RepID=UPI002FE67296
MEAPVDPSTRPQRTAAVLPGLELPGVREAGPAPSSPATSANDMVPAGELAARLSEARVGADLELAVSALEDVRRLESWVASTKHRLVREAQQAARAAHARWIDAHTEPVVDGRGPGRGGLPRAERLAVAERDGIAQIACALHLSESAASNLLTDAIRLTEHLSRTADALASGSITAAAAELISGEAAEYTDGLAGCVDEDAIARLRWSVSATEESLLGAASRGQTRSQLQARARRVREICHPSSFAERSRAAHAERFVRISPDQDGMARLTALLPAAVAWRIDGHLSAVARALRAEDRSAPPAPGVAAGPGAASAFGTEVLADAERPGDVVDDANDGPEWRTVAQLRADVLADLLLGLTGSRPAGGAVGAGSSGDAAAEDRVPQMLLTMPAETLLGGDEPGHLGHFGSITAADARELALAARSFMLGVTVDGVPAGSARWSDAGVPPDATRGGAWVMPVLATNGSQYRLPAALRRALAARDGTCRFPGCRRSAARCDVDHVVAWADGGSTEPGNLAHLCRKHHVLKHHSAWTVDVGPPTATIVGATVPRDGRLIWTSPAGRRYATEPDDPPPF